MWGGVLLLTAGAWVLFQVLGGNALGRLGIVGDAGGGPAPVGKGASGPVLQREVFTHPGLGG